MFDNKKIMIFLALLCLGLGACSKKSRSSRDARREQIRTNAESKRRELQPLVGVYRGILSDSQNNRRDVSLNLDVKDVPEGEEGEIDAVLVPKISGYLRMNFGAEGKHFVSFGIDEAAFDQSTGLINLKMKNEKYQEIVVDLSMESDQLNGTWNAPHLANSGEISLFRNGANLTGEDQSLRSTYKGYATWDSSNSYQDIELNLRVTPRQPDDLVLAATLKMYRGPKENDEYFTFDYDEISFNPITAEVDLQADATPISVRGKISDGKFAGSWVSKFTDGEGQILLSKGEELILPESLTLLPSVSGTYEGDLVNVHADTNLPKNFQITLSATGSSIQEIQLIGGMRNYLGDFGTTEYVDFPFTEIEYNFFTRVLIAKTSEADQMAVYAKLDSGKLIGYLNHKTLGKIGEFALEQK